MEERTTGYIKFVIAIHKPITYEKFLEIAGDLEDGIRAPLDVSFDIPYHIKKEIHQDT